MATTRLFSRSRPLFAPTAIVPSCPIRNLNTCASSASPMEDFKAIEFSKRFDEMIWNIRREESKKRAKREGSPFTILEDHISTHNVCDNSKRKNFEEHLRGYKDINRLLYVLALEEVIPSEKLYMEYLINEDKHILVEYRWRYRDFHSLFIIYSKRFGMLPERCLRRGIELHMSRIPHKYSMRKNLPKVFRKELLRKLEEDYETLTSKIHDLPSISEEMISCEIKSLVDHVPDANLSVEDPNYYGAYWWLGRPWFH